ncbi:MAG: hypothetical protein HRU31_07165 [Rhodobacteraceae bacterium]|nr:hypothetical protein [Paracoccaceae bacterium]
MKKKELQDLLLISQLKFDHACRDMAKVTAAEAELRQGLQSLADQQSEIDRQLTDDLSIRTTLKDGVLLRSRNARMARDITSDLSKIMQQKLAMISDVQKAFGRLDAMKSVENDFHRSRRNTGQ